MAHTKIEPFAIKDCALISIATGERAHNLMELRNRLSDIEPGCIYYHFWGGRLKPRFDTPEYSNDFAAWAKHELHDGITAERLAVIHPSSSNDMEDLREELIDAMEERVYESEVAPWRKAESPFHFIKSQIVVFDTGKRMQTPEDLFEAIASMSAGSIFYHFIDARRRTPDKVDDFRAWLSEFGEEYQGLIRTLSFLDPYFATLLELRQQIVTLFRTAIGATTP